MPHPVLKYYLSEKARQAGVELRVPRPGDAGFDLQLVSTTTIPPRGFALLETGVHLSIPEQYVGLIRDRSSVAMRGGAVTAGVIDASYRGEVKIAMHNLSDQPLSFAAGDRIAQCVVVPHLPGVQSRLVDSAEALGESERGDGGFGSTGK